MTREKQNILAAIKRCEGISHYHLGAYSFQYDFTRFLINYKHNYSYKEMIKRLNEYYGLRKDQVDRLICVNDTAMQWERKDKIIRILKEYANASE